MELDIDLAAAERTEAARQLIETAQSDGIVSLGVLGGMDLCILGGPKHPVFPETVAKAWLNLGDRARKKLIEDRTADMVNRGLLTKNPPAGHAYALSPHLGVALAARCRPAFIVTASAGPHLRPLRLFALGDQAEPMRGLVLEAPISLPDTDRKHPNNKKLGPLGWLYSYALLTPSAAAFMLAEWVSNIPPDSPRGPSQPPYVVTLFRPGGGHTPTAKVTGRLCLCPEDEEIALTRHAVRLNGRHGRRAGGRGQAADRRAAAEPADASVSRAARVLRSRAGSRGRARGHDRGGPRCRRRSAGAARG